MPNLNNRETYGANEMPSWAKKLTKGLQNVAHNVEKLNAQANKIQELDNKVNYLFSLFDIDNE